jgi:hypothetical protein
MTEEIIIDGINVAGCEFAVKPINDNRIKCHCVKGLLQIAKMHEQPESVKSGLCENNPNCYYKQLKRLEQENKELGRKAFLAEQNARTTASTFCEKDNKIIELEQENKELKEWKDKVVKLFESACRCKYLNEETDICSYTNEKCININKCAYKYQELSDIYRSALEEINKIAEPRFVNGLNEEADLCNLAMDRIQNKINEVLNDN